MKNLLILFTLICAFTLSAQLGTVNHWENSHNHTTDWKYFEGTTEPTINWREIGSDFSNWKSGKMPFSTKDSIVTTLVNDSSSSLYLVNKFLIEDTSIIKTLVIQAKQKDGFNLYLNGYKIEIINIPSLPYFPSFNDTSTYPNILTEKYKTYIPLESTLHRALRNDSNIIAIHLLKNDTYGESHLYADFNMYFGLNSSDSLFESVPDTFQAPPLYDSISKLPIVRIQTNNQTINSDSDIIVDAFINYNPEDSIYNYSDTGSHYLGKATIKIRGQSSKEFPKKSYSFSTIDNEGEDRNVELFDFPSEHDWVLNAPYTDKTHVRNKLAYDLWRKLGHYSPRTKFVEVFIDEYYNGIYLFLEKIKRDPNRVNVNKLNSTEVSGNDLTGGYILKIDKQPERGYDAWKSEPESLDSTEYEDQIIHYVYPKAKNITYEQRNYIYNYMIGFEEMLLSEYFNDSIHGYQSFIDIQSFIDYMLHTEFTKDIDSYKYSVYLHKKKKSKGGKIHMGPAWDYNFGLGNNNTESKDRKYPYSWMYNSTTRLIYWFDRLMQDSNYAKKVDCRWKELRKGIYSNDSIYQYIDNYTNTLEYNIERSLFKWDQLGRNIWPNDFVGDTYEEEINYLKDWTIQRAEWMDDNIPEECPSKTIISATSLIAIPSIIESNTTIHFELKKEGHCRISIQNNFGQEVQVPLSEFKTVGNYSIECNIVNFTSGIYTVSIFLNGEIVESKKIVKL